jgi:hypothetical protein
MLSQSSRGSAVPSHHQSPAAGKKHPEHDAVMALRTEDQQMRSFLNRMQRRDDGHHLDATSSGPTVPTALSRRLLHKQGVGFVDDTVCAIASASADRFLATLLHQAGACRDQRLKGAEEGQRARKHRKRHIEQYLADTDGRRQRKLEYERQRERANLKAIAVADASRRGGGAASKKDADGNTNTKKTKKATPDGFDTETSKVHGIARPEAPDGDDDSHDSLDDEEEYYQQYYDDQGDGSDDDEDDETLQLTDISRPLQAWDFYVAGKLGEEWSDSEADNKSQDDTSGDEKAELGDDAEANNESSPANDDGNSGQGFPSPGRPSQNGPPVTPMKLD